MSEEPDNIETFNEKDLTSPESIKFEKVADDPDSKKDTKRLLISIAIIVLFFLIGFAAIRLVKQSSDEVLTIEDLHRLNLEGKESDINYMYEGYSFVKSQALWYTQVQNEKGTQFDIPLHYSPKELEDITIIGDITDEFLEQPLYITFDPLSSALQYVALSSAELSLNLVSGFGLSPIAACDKNETLACATRPIISSCEDDKAIIYLQEDKNTGVLMNGNCVILRGEGPEMVKATDRFLLKLYSIMK